MKLIIGLGNPGKEYAKTRHNVGFMVLDYIVKLVIEDQIENMAAPNKKWKNRVGALIFEINSDQEKVLLVAPQKFMNLSGQVLLEVMKYYDVQKEDIIIISDDLNVNFGTIRLRTSGGDGGHNGLKNIIDQIGGEFTRIRIGIKNEILRDPSQWHDFVLARFTSAENKKLPQILDLVAKNVLDLIKQKNIEERTLEI